VLSITGLLFIGVLYFVFKQRVLRPVVRLSDVVNRLAAQDFDVEPPTIGRIDEIGDMAQAIRVFRENGLERQRLEAERSADLAMRDLLSRMTQRMQASDSLLDLKEVVQRFVPEIAPGFAGALYLLDPARNAVTVACDWLDPSQSRAEFSPMACWALRRGLPHRPGGEQIDVPCDHLADADTVIPDTLCLPLMAQRETLGLLYFERRIAADTMAEPPALYLQMLAENIGLALGNLRLRDALRAMAMADPLTGLANRRQLDSVLDTRLGEADRLDQSIACLMIDVDHFKSVNDRFGHDAGDAVLREVGAVLKFATREQGDAFRYGGEEFVLLMSGDAAGQAESRAEEVRSRIAGLRLNHNGVDLGPISVSIGVACATGHCAFDRLLATADAALYRAKALGRNRVVIANKRETRASA
jgi:diguanylate cyclase (GGDEF)-like protein